MPRMPGFVAPWLSLKASSYSTPSTCLLQEQFVNRHLPARHRGFSFGQFAASVDSWVVRVSRSIDFDYICSKEIHVPNDKRSCRKVVSAFSCDRTLGIGSVIMFACDLSCKYGSAIKEPHAFI